MVEYLIIGLKYITTLVISERIDTVHSLKPIDIGILHKTPIA